MVPRNINTKSCIPDRMGKIKNALGMKLAVTLGICVHYYIISWLTINCRSWVMASLPLLVSHYNVVSLYLQ